MYHEQSRTISIGTVDSAIRDTFKFEVVRVEEEASLIRIYLDESVKAEYKENPEIESKGFCEAVTIRDFPIRDKGVDLIVRRRNGMTSRITDTSPTFTT